MLSIVWWGVILCNLLKKKNYRLFVRCFVNVIMRRVIVGTGRFIKLLSGIVTATPHM